MGIFSKLLATEKRSLSNPPPWLEKLLGATPTTSGVPIDEMRAMQSTAVYACVRILAETIASLPLHVYRRLQPRGKERAQIHHLYELLHMRPNPEMTSFTFRETLQTHLALWGNAYAEIEYDGAARPIALWPLLPNKTKPFRDERTGEIKYRTVIPHGEHRQEEIILDSIRVLHIPGLSMNGLVGMSPIQAHREAIGLAKAAEEFGSRFFSNGLNAGGVLSHPSKLSDEAYERLKKDIEEKHQGLGKSHRFMILEEGMKFEKIGIPPNDAQFLETRKFQTTEIARIYRIPPHMLADLERATFSNIEHQSIDFVKYTILPWLRRWEQAMNVKLLTERGRRQYFIEFVVEGLLRGDSESRSKFYREMFNIGVYSINDILEKENENPIGPAGDIHYVPLNMIPAEQAAAGIDNDNKQIDDEDRSNDRRERAKEIRQRQYANQRRRIANRYKNAFREAAQKMVAYEKEEIQKQINEHLNNRSIQSFRDWLEQFYKQVPDRFRELFGPVIREMGEEIRRSAEQEAGKQSPDRDINKFYEDYLVAFLARYTDSSIGQIRALLDQAEEEDLDPGELLGERLEEWEERRPDKVAMNEVIQLSNAVAVTVFTLVGVSLKRWISLGSKTCPLCSELDGRVVGIEQEFVSHDQKVGDMKVYRGVKHPPLHQGCECEIVAE